MNATEPQKTPNPIFEARRICKGFTLPHGQTLRVLEDVSIVVNRDEIVGIIGASGSGKSTLLRILLGLMPSSKGERFFHQKKTEGLLDNVSMVFQNFALYPWMTVRQNIEIVLKVESIPLEERKTKVDQVIALVGLTGFEEAYPKEISGGMKQRVGIARALVCNPELLFMDEPFSAMDAFMADGLRSEILNIWGNPDRSLCSIVFVSHDIKEVVVMADRIIVMEPNPGRVRAELRNPLPRPRDNNSAGFLHFVDELHRLCTPKGVSDKIENSFEELITPLLPITIDAIGDFLQYLQERKGAQDFSRIGIESNLEFDKIVIIAQAAEMLNFVEISRRAVLLTPEGKEYFSANYYDRRDLWKKQLLTIPLFVKVQKFLERSSDQRASKESLLEFLIKELPHQDAQRQLLFLIRWGQYGKLFTREEGSARFF